LELGGKLRIPGGSMTVALFDTRIRDFQTSYSALVGTPAVAQNIVGNSNVRTRGFEAAVNLAPVDGLRLSGNVQYARARFSDNFPANGSLARVGDPLTRNPHWTGQFDADYEQNITSDMRGFLGLSANYASETLFQFIVPQPLAPRGEARTLIDGRLGFGAEDKSWELAVVGTNLTNKRVLEFVSTVSAAGGAYYGVRNRPRTIAVQLTLKR
jgi:outer membrane receptor protein involved in Fe transport